MRLTIVAFDREGYATEDPRKAWCFEWIDNAGNTVYVHRAHLEEEDTAVPVNEVDIQMEILRMESLSEPGRGETAKAGEGRTSERPGSESDSVEDYSRESVWTSPEGEEQSRDITERGLANLRRVGEER